MGHWTKSVCTRRLGTTALEEVCHLTEGLFSALTPWRVGSCTGHANSTWCSARLTLPAPHPTLVPGEDLSDHCLLLPDSSEVPIPFLSREIAPIPRAHPSEPYPISSWGLFPCSALQSEWLAQQRVIRLAAPCQKPPPCPLSPSPHCVRIRMWASLCMRQQ